MSHKFCRGFPCCRTQIRYDLCMRKLTTSTRQHLKADKGRFPVQPPCVQQCTAKASIMQRIVQRKHYMKSSSLCFPGLDLPHLDSLCVACLTAAHAVVGRGFVMTGCVPYTGLDHTRYPLKGKFYPPKAPTCTDKEGPTVCVTQGTVTVGIITVDCFGLCCLRIGSHVLDCETLKCSWPSPL